MPQESATPLAQSPHRRYNPLLRKWVLISPQRTQRPWLGEVNAPSGFSDLRHDPQCYLCPGNPRAGGHQTPKYDGVYVFDNDYPALLPQTTAVAEAASPLLQAEPELGRCKVICFHPDHNLTLPLMQLEDIRKVVDTWTEEFATLSADPNLGYIQIFENRGAMMGASNPHPHCQIWATQHVPDEPALETETQRDYLAEKKTCMLCDYLAVESKAKDRIVTENEHFVALVPWWAVWPFETLLLPKRHLGTMPGLTEAEKASLADILKQITTRYDNLFQTSFPYTMGFHQSPVDGSDHPEWHFHAHFYPPLLRSATVRKFMVGFELLGMPQRDITPESAAERLRAVPAPHFTLTGSR
ncbi:UDP-glucose--hexose-1-phosphate uridylyltransferase [Silvibacterium acidisoli]|uniref:UDP-glucose--hexose-1-phosphate uridylyltransferase n=1 Tax=Acidobacteriaceae bacterium ZG23-2 TaxID=2883246 RepID=UPI00406D02E8